MVDIKKTGSIGRVERPNTENAPSQPKVVGNKFEHAGPKAPDASFRPRVGNSMFGGVTPESYAEAIIAGRITPEQLADKFIEDSKHLIAE